jgi:hypothetical protein
MEESFPCAAPDAERVLVVVVNNAADWARICAEHWYRIPQRRAPARLAAAYLAFYHTKAVGETRWSVAYYAPVLRYHLLPRRALLPAEGDHPRADDLYYRLELGEVEALPRPIPAQRLRRLTFLSTTLERLLRAQEVSDLWERPQPQDGLRAMRADEEEE